MDGVSDPDDNGMISNLLDLDAEKQTFERNLQNWLNLTDEMAFYSTYYNDGFNNQVVF
ncbi:hypothetical protein Hanom_Chr12g01152531 [Helianthus anomalus]